jgi:hypothetical protein
MEIIKLQPRKLSEPPPRKLGAMPQGVRDAKTGHEMPEQF